tara:strand:- start:41 stop:799 length:759 start_codon:yes stop_codon:yes gene_type:complete
MSKVVIGDCIATAVNVLLPEILGTADCVVDMVSAKKKLGKDLQAWFLRKNTDNVQSGDIVRLSHTYKLQKEKEMAWPSMISNCVNLAVTGETFQGMHKKIKDYVAKNGRPDIVLVTDFSESHRCVVLNRDRKKYVVKRDLNLLDAGQDTWPPHVYNEFCSKVNQQEIFGKKYQRRKHKKSFAMLAKYLQSHGIKYKFLLFRKENQYISHKYEDLTHFITQYQNNDGFEISSKKLSAQREIASYVQDVILHNK